MSYGLRFFETPYFLKERNELLMKNKMFFEEKLTEILHSSLFTLHSVSQRKMR